PSWRTEKCGLALALEAALDLPEGDADQGRPAVLAGERQGCVPQVREQGSDLITRQPMMP
ncbi:MAG: hypothetical protein PVF51_11030, partial [Nitrospirota bacterium]